MDGNVTNKYLYCVFGYLFFDIIFTADYRGQAKPEKQSDQVLYGKSNKQIAIKLSYPMIMALLIILFCVPLLNGKMNLIFPVCQ